MIANFTSSPPPSALFDGFYPINNYSYESFLQQEDLDSVPALITAGSTPQTDTCLTPVAVPSGLPSFYTSSPEPFSVGTPFFAPYDKGDFFRQSGYAPQSQFDYPAMQMDYYGERLPQPADYNIPQAFQQPHWDERSWPNADYSQQYAST